MIDDIKPGGAEALRGAADGRRPGGDCFRCHFSIGPSAGRGNAAALTRLSDKLAAVLPGLAPQAWHGVWLASGSLPGAARSLAADLAASTDETPTLVRMALAAPSRAEFLDVNVGLIRLLEVSLPQAPEFST